MHAMDAGREGVRSAGGANRENNKRWYLSLTVGDMYHHLMIKRKVRILLWLQLPAVSRIDLLSYVKLICAVLSASSP